MLFRVAELVGMTVAGFVLKQSAETAVQLIPVEWYSEVHFLVQAAGVDRAMCLAGTLGLGLVFLCVAGATAAATLVRRSVPVLETPSLGLALVLGCGLSGAWLGWSCAALLAWGLTGFWASAFTFSLALLFMNKHHVVEAPSRMLGLHVITVATMYLGLSCGQVIDLQNPRLGLLNVALVPAACVMGVLVTTFLLRMHSQWLIFSFMLLVPFSGFVFGVGTERHQGAEPQIHHTVYTLRSSVYTFQILAGVLGAVGGIYISRWDPAGAGRLVCWISVPAAVTLSLVQGDSPPTGVLLGVPQQGVAAGGALGLVSGLAAASGVALGLASMSAGLCALAPLGLGADFMLASASRKQPRVLADAAVSLAVLGVVMVGAAIVGLAGVLTAALGSPGRHGAALGGVVATLRAVSYLYN